MADLALVVAEHQEGKPKKITYEMLTAARSVAEELDAEVGVLVMGHDLDADALAEDMGARGADVLFVADHPDLKEYAAEPYAEVIRQLIEEEEPVLVLFGMTPAGRDLAPCVAAKVEAGLASDITGLEVEEGELYIKRPIFSGQAIATVRITRPPALVTVRPNTWAAAPTEQDEAADVEEVDVDELPENGIEVLAVEAQESTRPELTEASIIVAGGRGLQGPENFHLIEELADLLGAAVGTTRAVVDAGWRPYEEQVGQTGKTVSPQLYIAIGISGAIQHVSGMRTSRYIVAINKDPEAPIFKLADYGIVGDLFKVVPELIQAIKEYREQEP
ncbi:MAG: electron transfer flavoprotein subunit alpha/FixB family protein [Ardenticatenia bacterium]|nr:electron transfer flavoprotein subunit alpha/FixB family protein [Ardenticatenia bacterium]